MTLRTAALIFLLLTTLNAQAGDLVTDSITKGRLTIHSSIEGQTSSPLFSNLRGHSWLSFSSLSGQTNWTVGTWGKEMNLGNQKSKIGVNFNLEMGRHPNTYRTTLITKSQYNTLLASIKSHDNWTYQNNCSYFASTVWNEVTGEHLENWSENQNRELKDLIFGDITGTRNIPLPSPAGLFDSIFISNGYYYSNDGDKIRRHYEESKSDNVAEPEL